MSLLKKQKSWDAEQVYTQYIIHIILLLCALSSQLVALQRRESLAGITSEQGCYWYISSFVVVDSCFDGWLCVTSPDHITEDEARTALRSYVAENCCYGKGAVNTMNIDKIAASNAYHVRSQSTLSFR